MGKLSIHGLLTPRSAGGTTSDAYAVVMTWKIPQGIPAKRFPTKIISMFTAKKRTKMQLAIATIPIM
jgi:hypothetical protein